MADDYDDVGTFEIFPFTPNWGKRISRDLILGRFIQKYLGTSSALVSYTDNVPEVVKIGITIYTKEDEYNFIDFYVNHKGKLNKFWLRSPVREFTLKEPAVSGSGAILVHRNGAVSQYQGYERIWILMNDGDILGRKVANVTDDAINDRYSLTLGTPLDRDLTVSNHVLIARLLLGRFNEDSLINDYETDRVSEEVMLFQELVKEYGEIT